MVSRRALARWMIGGALAASAAFAQPLDPHRSLLVPTPEGPKLSVPEIASPPPLTLQHARPLQIQPQGQRPSLNVLPRPETVAPGDEGSEDYDTGEAPSSGPYLQHGR